MSMTDPIADILTRMRNALHAKMEMVDIPSSNLKVSIAKILREEGFINNYKIIDDNKQGILKIYFKYDEENIPVISELKRISKPGRRVYVKRDKIPFVLNGLGISVLSTSKGILSDRDARKFNIGGELICKIW